jgi:selenide, water dikinase
MDHPDDAAVYRLPSGERLVQTVDMISPIVNDAMTFGRIAAANSLSDVYAMGGRPLTAMNIVCFPGKDLPLSVLKEVLAGAMEKIIEAQCLLVGGHSVDDPELKFGLSVTGLVDHDTIWSIERARVGDVLVLTKPIGTGILNQALRKDAINDESPSLKAAIASMCALNALGARAGRAAGTRAATDVTGFGLIGHSAQFARASQVTFEISRSAIPTFDGVRKLIADGFHPRRAKQNADAYRDRVAGIQSEEEAMLLFDPQTSGGLMLSLPESGLPKLSEGLRGWELGVSIIGRVVERREHDIAIVH